MIPETEILTKIIREDRRRHYLEDPEMFIDTLRQISNKEKNPVRRKLRQYEHLNSSVGSQVEIQSITRNIWGYQTIKYTVPTPSIVKHKVGVDFMTNQPIYRIGQ